MRSLGVYVWVFLAAGLPCWGLESSWPTPPRRVGILPLDSSAHDSYQFRLLEKQVQRWLENLEGFRLVTTRLPVSLRTEAQAAEEDRQKLQRLLDGSERGARWATETAGLFEKLDRRLELGPLLQRVSVALALWYTSQGDRVTGQDWWVKALALHPDGRLDERNVPGQNPFPEVTGPLRQCEVTVRLEPVQAQVTWNGFVFGSRREFRVTSDRTWSLQLTAPGYQPVRRELRCGSLSRRQLSVTLANAHSGELHATEDTVLPLLAASHRLDSVLLVEPKAGNHRLLLYTPNHGLEELPLREPLRVASQNLGRPEGALAIVSDAAQAVLIRHGLREPAERVGQTSGEAKQWYNNTVLWVVGGGVMASVLLALLLTQKSEVRSQAGLSVKFE